MLTEMEAGKTYEEALREAQERGFAEADPTDDVSGADAAAKMAILATVAFNSRFALARRRDGRDRHDHAARRRRGARARHGDPPRRRARLLDGKVDVRVSPALVDRHHPLAAVEGAFNAVMLQGDAIREITLEGPGAGGVETASAVIADMALGDRDDGHGLPAERPGLAEPAAARAAARTARPSTSTSRSTTGPACSRASPTRSPSARSRSRGCCSTRTATARRCTSSRTTRARARSTRRSRRSRRWPRCARKPLRVPRRLRARRRGARMGVIERYPRPAAGRPRHADADARRGRHAADRARGGSASGSGVDLHFKFEGMNPTGSFKDRGMVGRGREGDRGRRRRRSSARRPATRPSSAAAYAAARGCTALVLCPAGAVAAAKLAQSRAVGAKVREVQGSFDEALRNCLEIAEEGRYVLVNSLNPDRIEGQKTAAFEIVEAARRRAPDVLALPYGGGGNTVAYAKGFAGGGRSPADDLGARRRARDDAGLGDPDRRAGPPRRGRGARRRRPRRAGRGRRRGHHANVARARRAWRGSSASRPRRPGSPRSRSSTLEPGSTVVCVLTGHGLKDTAAVDALHARAPFSSSRPSSRS